MGAGYQWPLERGPPLARASRISDHCVCPGTRFPYQYNSLMMPPLGCEGGGQGEQKPSLGQLSAALLVVSTWKMLALPAVVSTEPKGVTSAALVSLRGQPSEPLGTRPNLVKVAARFPRTVIAHRHQQSAPALHTQLGPPSGGRLGCVGGWVGSPPWTWTRKGGGGGGVGCCLLQGLGAWGLGPGLRDVTTNGVGGAGVRGCRPQALLASLPLEHPCLALQGYFWWAAHRGVSGPPHAAPQRGRGDGGRQARGLLRATQPAALLLSQTEH